MSRAHGHDGRNAVSIDALHRAVSVQQTARRAAFGGLEPSLVEIMQSALEKQHENERLSAGWRGQWKAALDTWRHVNEYQRASIAVAIDFGMGSGLNALAIAERERLFSMRGMAWGSSLSQFASFAASVPMFREDAWASEIQRMVALLDHATSARSALDAYMGALRAQRLQAADEFNTGQRRLLRALGRLDRAVGQMWGTASTPQHASAFASPKLVVAPSVQILTGTRSTTMAVARLAGGARDTSDLVASLDDQGADEQIAQWVPGHEELAARLEAVLPGAAGLFLGARHAFAQQGPDFLRQMAVSARELLSQLLRTVAPDDIVRSWHTPQCGVPLFVEHSKEISRKARLAFLTRNATPGYALALSKDRDLIEGTLIVLNEATHSVAAPLSSKESQLLQVRIEAHLQTILLLAEG